MMSKDEEDVRVKGAIEISTHTGLFRLGMARF